MKRVVLVGIAGGQATVIQQRYRGKLKIEFIHPDKAHELRTLVHTRKTVLVRVDRVSHKHTKGIPYEPIFSPAEMFERLEQLCTGTS